MSEDPTDRFNKNVRDTISQISCPENKFRLLITFFQCKYKIWDNDANGFKKGWLIFRTILDIIESDCFFNREQTQELYDTIEQSIGMTFGYAQVINMFGMDKFYPAGGNCYSYMTNPSLDTQLAIMNSGSYSKYVKFVLDRVLQSTLTADYMVQVCDEDRQRLAKSVLQKIADYELPHNEKETINSAFMVLAIR